MKSRKGFKKILQGLRKIEACCLKNPNCTYQLPKSVMGDLCHFETRVSKRWTTKCMFYFISTCSHHVFFHAGHIVHNIMSYS